MHGPPAGPARAPSRRVQERAAPRCARSGAAKGAAARAGPAQHPTSSVIGFGRRSLRGASRAHLAPAVEQVVEQAQARVVAGVAHGLQLFLLGQVVGQREGRADLLRRLALPARAAAARSAARGAAPCGRPLRLRRWPDAARGRMCSPRPGRPTLGQGLQPRPRAPSRPAMTTSGGRVAAGQAAHWACQARCDPGAL